MEREEMEAQAKKKEMMEKEQASTENMPAEEDPSSLEDASDYAWMQSEIEKNKQLHGEDFGEDLDLKF